MRPMLLAAVLCLSACGGPLQTAQTNPPRSMQPFGTILTNHPPESPNSLPPGALVIGPLTGPAGQLNSVVVGPPG